MNFFFYLTGSLGGSTLTWSVIKNQTPPSDGDPVFRKGKKEVYDGPELHYYSTYLF